MSDQQHTNVPPPPAPEVLVRTMRSDIASVARGEVEPRPESVSKIENSIEEDSQIAVIKGGGKSKKIILTVVLLLILALGCFVLYPMVMRSFSPVSVPASE